MSNEDNTAPSELELEIPVILAPDGRVQGWIGINKEGEHTEDVGLLYDSFEMGVPTRLITVKATVDMDALFAQSNIEGEVTPEDT